MKKEKTIRTYQRRTKTGKVVTVKQHTAKYDAAEALKEAAKKKGAGDELEALKKKPKEKNTLVKEELEALREEYEAYIKGKKHPMSFDEWRSERGSKVKSSSKVAKTSKASKVEKTSKGDSSYGFTADDYKAWYHWDQDADPRNKAALKVEKALKKQMGTKAYNKYFDGLTDSYSARGHNKAFKGLGETLGGNGSDKSGKKDAKTLSKDIKSAQESVENLTKMIKDKRFSRLSKKDQQHYKAKLAAEKALLKNLQSGKASSDIDEKAQKTYDETYKKASTSGKGSMPKKSQGDRISELISNGYVLTGKGKKSPGYYYKKGSSDVYDYEGRKILGPQAKEVISSLEKNSKDKKSLESPKKTLSWQRDAEVQDERDLANKRRAEAASAKDVKEWAKANKYHLKKNGLYAKGLGKGTHSVDDLRKLMRSSDSDGASKSKGSKSPKPFKHTDGGTSVEYDAAYAKMNKLISKHGGVPKKDHKDYAKYKEAEKYVNDFKAGKVGGTAKEPSSRATKGSKENLPDKVRYDYGKNTYHFIKGKVYTLYGKPVSEKLAERILKSYNNSKKSKVSPYERRMKQIRKKGIRHNASEDLDFLN